MAEVPGPPPASQLLIGLARLGQAVRMEAWRNAGPHNLSPLQADIVTLLHDSRHAMRQGELVAAVENDCDYCLAAHTVLGAKAGVTPDDLIAGRSAKASEPRTEAALTFARTVIATKGFVSDDDLDAVRKAGYDDGEIGEIVAAVALNTFTNYFNSVGQTTVDFPPVPPAR